MKNFISNLFKKGKKEAPGEEIKKAGEGDSGDKALEKEKAEVSAPGMELKVEGKEPEKKAEKSEKKEAPALPVPPLPSAPAASAGTVPPPIPSKKESLAGAAPVLKPLFGEVGTSAPSTGMPPVKPLPTPVGAASAEKKAEPAPLPATAPLPASAPLPSAENKPAPHQHLPFEGDLKEAIEVLAAALAEVYPQTVEQWEDGFRRDDNPEQEIAAWLHVANILSVISEGYDLKQPEKMECFKLLLACFAGSRDTVSARCERKLLSQEQYDQAVQYFYDGGYFS